MGSKQHLATMPKLPGQRLVASRMCFCEIGHDHVDSTPTNEGEAK